MNLKGSNVTIMVADMDRAISFYQGLGLKLLERWGDNYCMIEGPGITLGIHPSHGEQTGSGALSIGFMVDDINAAEKLLKDVKHTRHDDGKSGTYLNFQDPDGTLLYFVLPNW